jgi:hypothetical protein
LTYSFGYNLIARLARAWDRWVTFKLYALDIKANHDISKANQADLLSSMVLNRMKDCGYWRNAYAGEKAGIKAARIAVHEIFQPGRHTS